MSYVQRSVVFFFYLHFCFSVGSLCDNVALCSMKTRQAIMRQWTKPVLKLNLTKDSNAPTVEIVDSEMVVNFRLENASSIGSDLEDIFKSEIVQ